MLMMEKVTMAITWSLPGLWPHLLTLSRIFLNIDFQSWPGWYLWSIATTKEILVQKMMRKYLWKYSFDHVIFVCTTSKVSSSSPLKQGRSLTRLSGTTVETTLPGFYHHSDDYLGGAVFLPVCCRTHQQMPLSHWSSSKLPNLSQWRLTWGVGGVTSCWKLNPCSTSPSVLRFPVWSGRLEGFESITMNVTVNK